MIQHLPTAAYVAQPVPMLLSERAVIDCGCAAYVGIRLDTQEVALVMQVCGCAHHELGRHFQLLYQESLTEPTDRLAVDVADELLAQAAEHWTGARA